jgi:hypothetical protein
LKSTGGAERKREEDKTTHEEDVERKEYANGMYMLLSRT